MRSSVKFFLITFVTSVECLIIPEEIPSLLSLVYSNIPPIKKGTDSRIGLGFRLGPHADFQVLLELGPQTNTDPLSPATTEFPSKRETPIIYSDNLRDTLVMKNPERLAEYVNSIRNYFSPPRKKDKVSNTPGGKWIDWWRKNLLSKNEIGKIQFKKVPGIDDLTAQGSEDIVFVENDSANHQSAVVDHLRRLYKVKSESS